MKKQAPGLPRRLASMLYETLLLTAVITVCVLLPQTLYAMHAGTSAPSWLLLLHLMTVLAVYFVGFWHLGQTLAMKTWKIRLIEADSGGSVKVSRAALRHLLAWFSFGLGGAGILWSLLDRDGQFLHDRLAGTRLIPVSDAPSTTTAQRLPAKKSSRA